MNGPNSPAVLYASLQEYSKQADEILQVLTVCRSYEDVKNLIGDLSFKLHEKMDSFGTKVIQQVSQMPKTAWRTEKESEDIDNMIKTICLAKWASIIVAVTDVEMCTVVEQLDRVMSELEEPDPAIANYFKIRFETLPAMPDDVVEVDLVNHLLESAFPTIKTRYRERLMCMAGHRNVEEEKRIFRHELIQHAKETYMRILLHRITSGLNGQII